jgi:4-aminobutyrate aminotransferase-like enzyme
MGIDIYAVWRGQTKKEKDDQLTGFSVVDGQVGYLREAYHGSPYATMHLCAEAFEHGHAEIPAEVLRERLPEALRLAEERERTVYGVKHREEMEPVLQSFRDFVALCERKEKETGSPVMIEASW